MNRNLICYDQRDHNPYTLRTIALRYSISDGYNSLPLSLSLFLSLMSHVCISAVDMIIHAHQSHLFPQQLALCCGSYQVLVHNGWSILASWIHRGKVAKATKWAEKVWGQAPGVFCLRQALDQHVIFSFSLCITHYTLSPPGRRQVHLGTCPLFFPSSPLQLCPGVTCPKTSTANRKVTEKHWIPVVTHCNFYHSLVRFIMTQDQIETSLKDADNPGFQFWIPESHIAPDTSRQLSC